MTPIHPGSPRTRFRIRSIPLVSDPAPSTDIREWNAPSYHNVALPHVDWGAALLAGLPLHGDETVADLGCGSGRLTALLLERLPHGTVIAVDQSANMLAEAA